jgi:hypothetical protein
MPIKISVPFHKKDSAKALGAWWFSEEKTWVIPDATTDINPFMEWLPREEGFIIKWPHVIVKSGRTCWKCHHETPLIALGAKSFYALEYVTESEPRWTQWDYPVLFMDIEVMDEEITAVLQQRYPFFQLTYSKTAEGKYWANTCIHCHSLQGDNYNFMEYDGIFSFTHEEQASSVKRDYLKMKFNYYIRSGFFQSESNEWVLK